MGQNQRSQLPDGGVALGERRISRTGEMSYRKRRRPDGIVLSERVKDIARTVRVAPSPG